MYLIVLYIFSRLFNTRSHIWSTVVFVVIHPTTLRWPTTDVDSTTEMDNNLERYPLSFRTSLKFYGTSRKNRTDIHPPGGSAFSHPGEEPRDWWGPPGPPSTHHIHPRSQRHETHDTASTATSYPGGISNIPPDSGRATTIPSKPPFFTSENSDFRALVKHTNAGARLCLAETNWDTIPASVEKAIDKVTESIRPPLANTNFYASIQRAATTFKTSIQRQVKEHVVSKKAWTTEQIATLNQTDISDARRIAKHQLLRTNTCLNPNRADEILSEFREWQAHREFTLVRRRARPEPQPPTPSVASPNRFEALGQDGDSKGLEASKPAPMEAATPDVQAKRGRYSPDTSNRKVSRQTTTADETGPEVSTPTLPPTTPGHSSMGHALPPRTHSAPSNRRTTSPTPTTSRRIRASIFAPNNRLNWAIPEFATEEDTLFLTDSNGARMSHHTPPSWTTAGYRGANINDVCLILESAPLPTTVQNIILHVGLNDCHSTQVPIQASVTRLRQLLAIHHRAGRHVIVSGLPQFEDAPPTLQCNTETINAFLQEAMADTTWFLPAPEGFIATSATPEDLNHYSDDACEIMVGHAFNELSCLN